MDSPRPPPQESGSRAFLTPLFLGAHAENEEMFEKLLVESLRDHWAWRRSFHPEDPPPIPAAAARSPEYREFMSRMHRELQALSAALRRSVPVASPRYMGHMVSDLLLPGLIAHLATLPYNPNNVVDQAGPVTLDLEIEAGLQLARMFGFPSDEARPDCAFGHLTSGGTTANYEALWLLRAAKFYPLAVRTASAEHGYPLTHAGRLLTNSDEWTLLNLPLAQIAGMRVAVEAQLRADPDRGRAGRMARAIRGARLEALGAVEFFRRHPDCQPPVVLAPMTAHYSWDKAMRLLGLGTDQLLPVACRGMRMDVQALETRLAEAAQHHRPVLCAVGVLGTTEFGTFDPIHRIAAAREAWRRRGLEFAIHVDAAWGGYLSSIFRAPDGSLRPHEDVRRAFRYFPSAEVYAAFAALHEADSITVDPHKLGYVPYGAGALVCRDHRIFDFVAQEVSYLFDGARPANYRDKFRALGRYILEGSKAGASAAAVCVTHRTLPLDCDHFGRLQQETIRGAEYFFDRALRLAASLSDIAFVTMPFEPDSNLVCLAFNLRSNDSLAAMNAFTESVLRHLKVDATLPLQSRQFFGSSTRISHEAIGLAEGRQLLERLGVDPTTFRAEPDDNGRDADSILVLRHTLMNPWLLESRNELNYVDRYCAYLEGLVRSEALAVDTAASQRVA